MTTQEIISETRTELTKKIILTFFPGYIWAVLAVALFLMLFNPESMPFGILLLNLTFLLIFLKPAIILHETGHLIFAKLVGGIPKRMVLGRGHKVFKKEIGGAKIILNSNLNSGLAYASFKNMRFIHLKLVFFFCGGFVVNFAFSAAIFLIFDTGLRRSTEPDFIGTFGDANLLAGLFAIIPYRSTYQGLKIASDGLSILQIPFRKKQDLTEWTDVNESLEAYDLMEEKKYDEAISLYEKLMLRVKNPKLLNLNLGLAFMKLGNLAKATELLEELIPLIDEKPYEPFRPIIHNALGWQYLLENRLEEADKYSELAYNADPRSEYICGTRGSVLIELNRISEGKSMLSKDLNLKFVNSHILAAAIYTALAFAKNGEPEKAEKYLAFLKENSASLEWDENLLYERALIQIKRSDHQKTDNLVSL